MGISALGLVATGLVELALALLTGSVALLADALHNLSDVSSSAIVFVGFRICKRPPTPAYPYGYQRAEDLAGLAVIKGCKDIPVLVAALARHAEEVGVRLSA